MWAVWQVRGRGSSSCTTFTVYDGCALVLRESLEIFLPEKLCPKRESLGGV